MSGLDMFFKKSTQRLGHKESKYPQGRNAFISIVHHLDAQYVSLMCQEKAKDKTLDSSFLEGNCMQSFL